MFFLKLVLSLSNEGEDNLNSDLSFMWGFTLHISVRKIIASTWPEKRGKKCSKPNVRAQRTEDQTCCSQFRLLWMLKPGFSNNERNNNVKGHLLQQRRGALCESRSPSAPCSQPKGQTWGDNKDTGWEIRRTRKGYCNSSEGQLSETMVCEKQLHDEITFIWPLTCSLMFFPLSLWRIR